MRKPQEITIDRTLLIFVLRLSESKEFSIVSDVKLQHLVFLAELQMLGKGLRGFHYEFIVGSMIESHLHSGNQILNENQPEVLEYGISITDSCLGWDQTEELLLAAFDKLG